MLNPEIVRDGPVEPAEIEALRTAVGWDACEGRQIGRRLVTRGIRDMKEAGIQCVQVTYDESLRGFYALCGFHLFGGGVIDFQTMDWKAEAP